MSAIEKLAKKDKEAKLAENPAEPQEQEIKGPTTREILANKTQDELFGLHLEQQGEEGFELARKLKSGDAAALGRNELAELNKQRKDFLATLEQAKDASEVLKNTELLKEIIESTPELKDLADHAGPEGMRNAISRFLPRMAILDRERFAKLSDCAKAIKEQKKKIAEGDKEIKAICKEYDIDEDEYVEKIRSGNSRELEELVRGKMGFLKKVFTRASTIRKKAESLNKVDEMRALLAEMGVELKKTGSALEMALMDNETLHGALIVEITKQGDMPKLEAGASFSENKQLTEEDEKNARKEFEKRLADKKMDIDGISDEAYQQEVDSFSREYLSKKSTGKGGFWERVWQDLCKGKLSKTLERPKP